MSVVIILSGGIIHESITRRTFGLDVSDLNGSQYRLRFTRPATHANSPSVHMLVKYEPAFHVCLANTL